MPRRSRATLSPLLEWLSIGMKAAEMYGSSAQVIAHRTRRMMLAGVSPSQADRREFGRMGQEKADAAIESSHAVAMSCFATNVEIWTKLARAQLDTATALGALATSRTTKQALARHAALMRAARRSALAGRQASSAAARITASALTPVHSRVRANAKRLGK